MSDWFERRGSKTSESGKAAKRNSAKEDIEQDMVGQHLEVPDLVDPERPVRIIDRRRFDEIGDKSYQSWLDHEKHLNKDQYPGIFDYGSDEGASEDGVDPDAER